MSDVVCDRDERGTCDYQAQAQCLATPLVWGQYCAYERDFIQDRYEDLLNVFNALKKFYKDEYNLDGFKLNHTILWEICCIYANDLKPVRQFHAIEGGCDKNRRAAFLARLISNHRPIYIGEFSVPDSPDKQKDLILQINERYAFHTLHHFLDLPPRLFSLDGMNKVLSDLIFIFGHRDPQPESLVCIARLLSRTAEQYKALGAAAVREDRLKKKIATAKEHVSRLEKDLKKKSGKAA